MTSILCTLSRLAAFSMLAISSVACAADEPSLTLIEALDRPLIPRIETPKAEFQDAAFNIQEKLATTLSQADLVKGSAALAKRVRVLIGTLKEGRHAIVRDSISIRGYLQEFATQWAVAILIQDDVIIVAEPYEVSRFKHEIAILPPQP